LIFNDHSMLSAMPRFIRSPAELFIRNQKSRLHLFSDKNSWNDTERQSRNALAMAKFNMPHIAYY